MLVTLVDMKNYLSIPLSDTSNDAFLTEQLNLVSDTVEAYCRRKFNTDDYIQTYYGDDYELKPRSATAFHFPVTDVASITEDGTLLDPADYRLNIEAGVITKPNNAFFIATETIITYTAGYAVIPTPIAGVVKSVVEERYNKKTSGVNLNFGSDVQRVSIPGSISVDFDFSLSNNDRKSSFGVILGSQVNVLDYYRSERAVVGSGRLMYVADAP